MNSVSRSFSPSNQVIVADDTSSGRMVIAEVLSKNGFAVKEANDAFMLARLLYEFPTAHVVLNLTMPPHRGSDYVQSVRAQMSPGAKLVAYTANDSIDLERSVITAGADCFFPVPVPLDALLLALQ